jgi:MFS family permease
VQGAESAGDLVGPALAAVLVATLGLGGALLGVAALHVLAALALTSLLPRLAAARGAPAAEDAPTLRALAEGVRFAFGDPVLRLVLLLLAVLNVAVAGPVLVGGAVLAEEHLGGAERLGLLFAGFGAGSLAGLAAGALARPARRGAVLVACAAVLGATLAALGAARSLAAAVPLAAVMGLGAGFLGVVLVAWLQERVPAALRGRVMALVAFCAVALDPLSFALAGALLPLGTDVLLAAAGGLLVAWAAAALLVPAVRGLR